MDLIKIIKSWKLFRVIKSYLFHCDFCKNLSEDIICKKCLSNFKNWSGCFFCNGFCICKFFSIAIWQYDLYSSNAILKFKYCDAIYYSDFFGFLLNKKLENLLINLNIYQDILIVPVPTSKLRLLQRGYNQAVLLLNSIVKQMSKNFKIDKNLFFFKRSKYSTQKNKNNIDRLANTNTISIDKIRNKKYEIIIIVDDLIASGSTILKCYELAKDYSKNIVLLSIAKT